MKEKKEQQVVKITTNKIDYEIDYDNFRKKFRIFKYRMKNDNRWLSAYSVSRSLPAELCLSIVARKEKGYENNLTWYYILVPVEHIKTIYDKMTGSDDNPVELYEYIVEKNELSDRLILNLLLNTCTLEKDEIKAHQDYGKLLLVRADSFMNDSEKLRALQHDRVALELQVNEDFVLVASAVTFKRVYPGKNNEQKIEDEMGEDEEENVENGKQERKEKRIPEQYYSFDHLDMNIRRELPEDWVERFNDNTMTFYVRGSSNPHTRHVIEQLNLNQTKLHVGKTGVIYCIKQCLQYNYSAIIRSINFHTINETDKKKADYENTAKKIMDKVVGSLTYKIDDTVMSEKSLVLKERIISLLRKKKVNEKSPSPFLKFTENDNADCIIRLVDEAKKFKKKNKDKDSYHKLDRVDLFTNKRIVQHIEVKDGYTSKALEAALGRIMKEITVKRILSTKKLPEKSPLDEIKGWSFAVCKKVDDNKHVGLLMNVSLDGNIAFGRLEHPVDVPGNNGRGHINLLSYCKDRFEDKFGTYIYPAQETYYMLSKDNNIYHIVYTSEQALPEYEALKQFNEELKKHTLDMEKLMEIVDDVDIRDEYFNKEEYTADEIHKLPKKFKENHPVIYNELKTMIKDFPYWDQMRRVNNIDQYFGGLVDIHAWLEDNDVMKYVAWERGNSLNMVHNINYNGFPHVRAVYPFSVKNRNNLGDDYESILKMLMMGFGKAHYGTALPFGFKILSEMCDILCLAQFGIHWKQMNATQYKEWEGRFYKGKDILVGI